MKHTLHKQKPLRIKIPAPFSFEFRKQVLQRAWLPGLGPKGLSPLLSKPVLGEAQKPEAKEQNPRFRPKVGHAGLCARCRPAAPFARRLGRAWGAGGRRCAAGEGPSKRV